jgi:transcription elongation GreA/GreB family factor
MKERLSKEKRREQLLRIMGSHYEQAQSLADFSVDKISLESGVSKVLVYRLVGDEYKAMRSSLTSPESSTESGEHSLSQENALLRQRLSELTIKYKEYIESDMAGAIRHIEAQDKEIRTLRHRVELLERRLKEAGMFVTPLLEAAIDEEPGYAAGANEVDTKQIINVDEVYEN